MATLNEEPLDMGQIAREASTNLLHSYFTTQLNPLVRHHIDSYDQFLSKDLQTILTASNPILNVKERLGTSNQYKYTCEVFIGGEDGSQIYIGTPTVALENGKDIRAMYPNEARLRNLTYAIQVEADIFVRVTLRRSADAEPEVLEPRVFPRTPLFTIPLMLHSRYCVLNAKPDSVLHQMGECPQDQGGYFIIDGSEKVLITSQEGAFNTLYIQEQKADPKVQYYANILSLDPKTRLLRRVNFYWMREREKMNQFTGEITYRPPTLQVQLPNVLKPIPVFILFRALGIQSDEDILRLIFSDMQGPEAEYLADMLIPSMTEAAPFYSTYMAIQHIKYLTKGLSVASVLDIIHNHMFPHVPDMPMARTTFLAYCVRRLLRVIKGLDAPPSKDDTRNQRLLTSGFLIQMEFQGIYKAWRDAVNMMISKKFNFNKELYGDEKFIDMFDPGNFREIFHLSMMTEGIMRSFKGKWAGTTGSKSDENSGFLQALSRLSYLDFMSHCRRVILKFDKSMKLVGPRMLNPSQYGYFCTCETPSGASIGVTKNYSILTRVSTNSPAQSLFDWLYSRGGVASCEQITPSLATKMVPVFLNGALIGYTSDPVKLTRVLRLFKRTACLPPYSSSVFDMQSRVILLYMDEGRPLRPLLICEPRGDSTSKVPRFSEMTGKWRELVVGTLPETKDFELHSTRFVDPLKDSASATFDDYIALLTPHQGHIEYIDPYEQNQCLLANWPSHINPETTHMEVHPSSIMGLLGNMIPYPNHNQSPRNQLSSSQSKQAVSVYASNWKNRFDNSAHVLCYGEAPLSRTLYQDYIGNGLMTYGQNIILAMGMYSGYNQEDGVILNADALARGQFRSLYYKSYEAFEEDDPKAKTRIRIGNPKNIAGWLDLKSNLDYSKLDESGIVRVGEYIDQETAIVGMYMMSGSGQIRDASKAGQVWTSGRVESVVVTVNNAGLRLVKIRVVQDRIPVLGDKFSNRHGQKGTANMIIRGHDMPRTADGIVPDMIMNPTAIPSRMTIGQIHEMMGGLMGSVYGEIVNSTAFMNEGSPHELFGQKLEAMGFNKLGNHILYNGVTGEQIEADIYMGVVYGMRLKHMTEDKWNARGQGRKEQRTHQPTGGRGNEGGLKIGEMDRDTILAHGISTFLQESFMQRSDGTDFFVCNGCGTIPIYNEAQSLYLCPMCDGPIRYSGESVNDLAPIPPTIRSSASFSKVQMPYATKLLFQELNTFLTMGLRMLTTRDTTRLKGMDSIEQLAEATLEGLSQPLPQRINQRREEGVEEVEDRTNVEIRADVEAKAQEADEARADLGYIEQLEREIQAAAVNATEPLPGTIEAAKQASLDTQFAEAAAAQRAVQIAKTNPTEAPIVNSGGVQVQDSDKGPVIAVDTGAEAMATVARQAANVVGEKAKRNRSLPTPPANAPYGNSTPPYPKPTLLPTPPAPVEQPVQPVQLPPSPVYNPNVPPVMNGGGSFPDIQLSHADLGLPDPVSLPGPSIVAPGSPAAAQVLSNDEERQTSYAASGPVTVVKLG